MRLAITLAFTFFLTACAGAESFEKLLETKAIEGVCFTKQITRTTVVNGQAETLLSKVDADVRITETLIATYEDRGC